MAEEQTIQTAETSAVTGKKSIVALVAYLCTPQLLLLLCGGIAILVGIRPYEKALTYLNIAFMDTFKNENAAAGLIVKENEIATDYTGQTQEVGVVVYPVFGEQYATLSCEAVSMSVPVFWGSEAELLSRGACQSSGSVVLGEVGNVVIDAHVNTFFAALDQIQVGDEIVLYTQYGVFTYVMREQVLFEKTDKTYVLPTEADQLTLYTCVMDVLGSSTQRVGVLCDLVSKQFYETTTAE